MFYYGEANDNAGNHWHFCTDEPDCIPACARKVKSAEVKPVWFVTVTDDGRRGFLLGPYPEPEEAEANLARGKALANKADAFAAFYGFGLSSAAPTAQIQTVFGA